MLCHAAVFLNLLYRLPPSAEQSAPALICSRIHTELLQWSKPNSCLQQPTTTVLRPFVRDYPGEPVPEETLTRPPSWSSSNLYQLFPSTTVHSILLVQITCLAIFLHNLSPCPLWSISWSGALHLIFHTFLHPISVFFRNTCPNLRNLLCCSTKSISSIQANISQN